MHHPRPTTTALLLLLLLSAPPLRAQIDQQLVRAYLWPQTTAEFEQAEATLRAPPWTTAATRADIHDLEEILRAGPPLAPLPTPRLGNTLNELIVPTPGDRTVPVLMRLPTNYTPDRQWPLMFAMHGGPPGSAQGAIRGALNMIQVWAEPAETAGWIIASPAMVDVVARDGRTEDRLPYEIFQPEEARAVIDAVRAPLQHQP